MESLDCPCFLFYHADGLSRSYTIRGPGEINNEESGVARQLGWQHQLKDRVKTALQKRNEHDEESQSLPDELRVDDSQRTLLRRARSQEEFPHLTTKLLDTHKSSVSLAGSALSPVSVDGQKKRKYVEERST